MPGRCKTQLVRWTPVLWKWWDGFFFALEEDTKAVRIIILGILLNCIVFIAKEWNYLADEILYEILNADSLKI